MNSRHLVVLGVKANSWAWGIEQTLDITAKGIGVLALDFDIHSRGKSNRAKIQKEILKGKPIEVLGVQTFTNRRDLREMDKTGREWVKSNQLNKNWIESEIDGIPIGRIVMSNFARIAGTRDFDLELIPKNLQRKIVSLALLADHAFNKIGVKFDEISLSNGRSPIEAVFLSRARQYGKKINVIERGASTKQMFVYKTSPHFAPDWWAMMSDVDTNIKAEEIKSLSHDYWKTRLSGWDELSGRDWTKEFKSGKIPSEISSPCVMFFCTSQHEVPVITDFECTDLGFPSQQAAVKELVGLCQEIGKELVVKRHPNSVATDGVDRESEDWEWIKSEKNVIYIEPTSKVDTYALLAMAESVVTFRSSVGVEASALRIPARSMGPAEWAFKEETRVWNRGELESYILEPTLLSENIHETWGYLVRTFGKKLTAFSDITGGYAETLENERVFSADYYDRSLRTYMSRIANKLWSMRIKIFTK